MEEKITVTTLRVLSCNERQVCPGRHRIDGVPGSFVVLKQVADPAHAAALAKHVGPDELLGWTPDALFDPYPGEA